MINGKYDLHYSQVKCDERPGRCANCERLQLVCTGYNRLPAGTTVPQELPRRTEKSRRTTRACQRCRVSKIKCSGERPSCASCSLNNLACSYTDHGQDPPSGSSSTEQQLQHGVDPDISHNNPLNDSPESSRSDWQTAARSMIDVDDDAAGDTRLDWLNMQRLPDSKKIRALVNQYFQSFHPLKSFGFVHKPSFLRRLDNDLVSGSPADSLLYAMCTLGAQ